MKAYLKNFRQSPRKVRLVANLIRGKNVRKAQALLSFTDNKSAPALKKLVASAVSNARSQGKNADGMVIKEITVDQGVTMKRFMPMSRGRANQYRKRSSKISLILSEMEKENSRVQKRGTTIKDGKNKKEDKKVGKAKDKKK
ncbi:50S ribosomal protein L22 [Candidatus Kaiserbacteria bacterium CG10_big_fil_rev_8_21_14_0_10_43_70]|uniref:Large ribosomal subunit protein uL22 n=1 Tax=Candidatus Kaiserbacteria bacterium CG10_big_fil_rev_8_21_14_0_10_43_70 TaxID=1974605 RepID=A0A2H0UJI8_9BACT|nr:MAG: 50S ribosomal protein L22 [Candidatus Kaiserbacteria bacterium CG10_big_fil_rev_8_21_14_0_10_43_70]